MVKVIIADVIQQARYSLVVLLDKGGKQALPVWVGYWEGLAIASRLRKNLASSPLTFSFISSLLSASGSELEEVRIESLKEDTLYARAKIRHGNTIQEVEARPSDALALALHTDSPVFVAEEVMQRWGITLTEGNEKLTQVDFDTIVSKLKDKQPTSGLTAGPLNKPEHPRNLDFAEGITGWLLAGSHPQNYEEGVDRSIKRSGEASGYLKSRVAEPGGFGTLMQIFDAASYRNKRIRMSGYVKSEGVETWAGLWLHIDVFHPMRTLSLTFPRFDRVPKAEIY